MVWRQSPMHWPQPTDLTVAMWSKALQWQVHMLYAEEWIKQWTMKEIISKILNSKLFSKLGIITQWQLFQQWTCKWATIKPSHHHDKCAEGLCQDHSNAFILDLQHGYHSRCHMALKTVLHYVDFLFHFLSHFFCKGLFSPSLLFRFFEWLPLNVSRLYCSVCQRSLFIWSLCPSPLLMHVPIGTGRGTGNRQKNTHWQQYHELFKLSNGPSVSIIIL